MQILHRHSTTVLKTKIIFTVLSFKIEQSKMCRLVIETVRISTPKRGRAMKIVTKECQFVHSTSETEHVQIQVDNTVMVLLDKSCTLCVKKKQAL